MEDTMSSHTAGPWYAHEVPGYSRLRIESDTYVIAETRAVGSVREAELANAKLIAAAPDMFYLLLDAPCMCSAGHDPDNLECYRNRVEALLSRREIR